MRHLSGWKKKWGIAGIVAAVALAAVIGNPATTAWAEPAEGKINTTNVRVRESAVDGSPVGSLSENQSVTVIGDTEGSDGHVWYQITYGQNNSGTGWVRDDLIDVGSYQRTGTSATVGTGNDSDADADAAANAEGTFVVDQKGYDFAESIPADAIPDGFAEATAMYGNNEVPALQNSQGNVTLFYLQNTLDATDKKLFVFDEERNDVVPFIQTKTDDGYIVLTNIPEEEILKLADSFVATTCIFDKGRIMAYQMTEAGELLAEDAAISDMYYVYGADEAGEKGWYVYDSAQDTLQRNVMNLSYSAAASTEEAESETKTEAPAASSASDISSLSRMVMAALAVICLLLLILTIVFSVRYHRVRKMADNSSEADQYDDLTREMKERRSQEEQAAREKAAREKEKAAQEKAEKERAAREKEKAAKEKAAKEKERAAKEKAAREKALKEKAAKEKADRKKKPAKSDSIELHTPAGDVNLLDLDADADDYYDEFEDLNEPVKKGEVIRKGDLRSRIAARQNESVRTAEPVKESTDMDFAEESRNLESLIGEIVAAEEAKAAEEFGGSDAVTAADAASEEAARRKAAEEELARRQAAEEEAARRKAAEEELARRQAAEEELARRKAAEEEAARRKAAEEEVVRRKAAEEEAARRKAAEEEAVRRKAAEEEAARRKAAEEEAARQKAAEEEAARLKAAEEEAARQKAAEEDSLRKKMEEEISAKVKAAEEEAVKAKAAEEVQANEAEEDIFSEEFEDLMLKEANKPSKPRTKTEQDIEDILNQGFLKK